MMELEPIYEVIILIIQTSLGCIILIVVSAIIKHMSESD